MMKRCRAGGEDNEEKQKEEDEERKADVEGTAKR